MQASSLRAASLRLQNKKNGVKGGGGGGGGGGRGKKKASFSLSLSLFFRPLSGLHSSTLLESLSLFLFRYAETLGPLLARRAPARIRSSGELAADERTISAPRSPRRHCLLPPLLSHLLLSHLFALTSLSHSPLTTTITFTAKFSLPWLLSPRSSCSASGPTRTSRYEMNVNLLDVEIDVD